MDEKHRNTNYSGIVANIMISVLLIVVGASLLFIPGMKNLYFTYICAGFLLVWGVSMAVRYFAKDEYRIVSNYDFAIGVIVLLLAICFIARAKEVSGYFHLFLGILILIEGVVLLQHTIQMKQLKGVLWFVIFVMAVFLIAFAMIVLMDLTKILDQSSDLYYGLLMAAGGLGILSQILVGVRASRFRKDEEKAFWENAGDAVSYDATEADRRVPRNVNVGTGNVDFLKDAEDADVDLSSGEETHSKDASEDSLNRAETADSMGESKNETPEEQTETEHSDKKSEADDPAEASEKFEKSEHPEESDSEKIQQPEETDGGELKPSEGPDSEDAQHLEKSGSEKSDHPEKSRSEDAQHPEDSGSEENEASEEPAPWTEADEALFCQIKPRNQKKNKKK